MDNKIKVGYDSRTNLYTFKTPGSYSAKNVCVNGNPITDPLRGQKVGELMTINEQPETITYETSERKLIGYDNTETNTTISVKEYQEIVAKISETREYDDDSEEFTYDTLEDEVFATRFFRTHKAIYENINTVHNIEIEFIQYPVSEHSNIVPLYSIDAKNVFETKCKFTPTNIQTFKDICKARGIDDSRIDIPTHSGLRFVKIDSKFVSGMEEFEKTFSREIIASYEECVERMAATKNKLKELVDFHFAKQSQNVLDKGTVGSLLTELVNLEREVNGLDVKVKDYNNQRSAVSKIREMINIYKQLV
jgi:hypothetical protein